MILASFTSVIINHYRSALAICTALIAYIPLIMDIGGNAGSQSGSSVIRAISVGDVEFRDSFRVIWKELRVAFFIGITLAGVNLIKLLFIDKIPMGVSLVISLVMVLVILFAKLIGSLLPILANQLKLDPAIMASPLITTIVDTVSLLIYFSISVHILHLV